MLKTQQNYKKIATRREQTRIVLFIRSFEIESALEGGEFLRARLLVSLVVVAAATVAEEAAAAAASESAHKRASER